MTTQPPEERFFHAHQTLAAATWARSGGIALLPFSNAEAVRHGVRHPHSTAYRALGLRAPLLVWGGANGQRLRFLWDPPAAGLFAGLNSFAVYGKPAAQVAHRLRTAAVAERATA